MDRCTAIVGWLVGAAATASLVQAQEVGARWRGPWQVEGHASWRQVGGGDDALILEGRVGDADLSLRGRGDALQVPHRLPDRLGGSTVVTERFVRRAHDRGRPVHVWTVDDPDEMRDLLDLGVDGLMTDRTDVLRDVLVERGQWMGATP